jgi:hypothetical protein
MMQRERAEAVVVALSLYFILIIDDYLQPFSCICGIAILILLCGVST